MELIVPQIMAYGAVCVEFCEPVLYGVSLLASDKRRLERACAAPPSAIVLLAATTVSCPSTRLAASLFAIQVCRGTMIFKLFKQGAINPAVVGMVLAFLSTLVLFLFQGGLAEGQDPPANNEATGKPTISGTVQVGQSLAADTTAIADADGLSGATFSYQWLADDADIEGATESSYTLVLANLTKTIKVRVSFIDNADNAETLTSQAVGPVDHRGGQQLNGSGSGSGEQFTAVFSNVPASHDGSELRFNVTFTPETSLSYATLRDHAFSIVGGTIIKANRTTAGDAEWVIMVVPDLDSNENPAGPITVVLPPTTSCIVLSAICTADDVPLSNRSEATIPVSTDGPNRPGRPQDVTVTQGPDIGEMTLSWTAAPVVSDPEAAVRGYRVRFNCGGETETARLDADSRSFKIGGIDRSTTCLLNVAARNDGGYGPVAWAGSDSTYHPPMNPPEAPASITVTPDEDNEGTQVSWTAPAKGDAPTSYQISYWDIDVGQFQYIDHSSTTDLEAVIDVGPANLRTVAVRGHLGGIAYEDRGVWGSWAVGWHESATPSRLDTMTQSSLSLSLTYADGGTAGKKIDYHEDANLMCPSLGGVYVDTAENTAWIADPCSKWVHAFDIGSEDGTLTHNLDTSLTTDELYPPEGIGRLDPMYTPWTLWSDGKILWVAERDEGMLLPYRLSDGRFLSDQRFIMGPFNPRWGHSFLAPAAVWSDGKTVWVADAMIDQLIFAVKLEPERWLTFSPDLFVPSAFDNCYIPEKPRVSDVMPSATCTNETALRDALLDKRRDSPVGAYSDGRWLWVAVDYYKDKNKAGRLLAFNLLSGERAASRDITLHADIKQPVGMWSDGENLWVVDGATKRLYTFAIPAQTSQQQAANSPVQGSVTIAGTAQVGETLTANTSGITDPDGLDNATFSYQWLADDVGISGATGTSYTLTDSEEGKAVKVTVSFTDDAGNKESLTSVATAAVGTALSAALSAAFSVEFLDTPSYHRGQTAFTFELRFSETPVSNFSYKALRDHAFTVTGGEVTNTRRLDPPGNVRWEITVTPDGNGDVTVVLPSTQDCAGQGAICTGDGRMLSAEVTLVVTGLSLDDFDAGDGQTVLASALIQVGDRGRKNNETQDRAWYASETSAWHASGQLRDGSLAWNGMTLNRVVYFSETGSFRFNEADDIHIGESFSAGGVNRDLTVWIQTQTGAVSFLAKDNIGYSGSGYITFEAPTTIRSVLEGVSKGDPVIIAVSAPANS